MLCDTDIATQITSALIIIIMIIVIIGNPQRMMGGGGVMCRTESLTKFDRMFLSKHWLTSALQTQQTGTS
jgi:hypothetical protein